MSGGWWVKESHQQVTGYVVPNFSSLQRHLTQDSVGDTIGLFNKVLEFLEQEYLVHLCLNAFRRNCEGWLTARAKRPQCLPAQSARGRLRAHQVQVRCCFLNQSCLISGQSGSFWALRWYRRNDAIFKSVLGWVRSLVG